MYLEVLESTSIKVKSFVLLLSKKKLVLLKSSTSTFVKVQVKYFLLGKVRKVQVYILSFELWM